MGTGEEMIQEENMSSKSDNDNRSNQLNPNNDAYYSSRGIGGDDGYDDGNDGEHYKTFDWVEYARKEAWRRREMEMQTPIKEEFTFDFMSMSGSRAHLKATAQLPNKHYSGPLFSDCIDLIEKALYPRMCKSFVKETNSPIAYSRVRDGKGNELIWLQEEYRPRSNSKLYSPELQQQITQLNELWEKSTKFKVEDFKKLLQDYKTIPREDIGFIVTSDNYRQVRGY